MCHRTRGAEAVPRWPAWTRGVALCLLACLCLAPADALGQQPTTTPSAEELWQRYPLEATPEAGATSDEAPSPTGTPRLRDEPARTAAAADDDGGGWGFVAVLLLVLATASGAMIAAWIGRRRRAGRPAASPPAPAARAIPDAPPPRARAAPPARAVPDAPPPRARAAPAARAVPDAPPPLARVAPPDPAVAWRAEIDWREEDGAARFQVMAVRADAGDAAVVAESPAFAWPPATDGAVQALTAAVDRLETTLLEGGWSELAPGGSWYARRFGWAPVAEPRPAPAAPERPAARPGAAPARPAPARPAGRPRAVPARPAERPGPAPAPAPPAPARAERRPARAAPARPAGRPRVAPARPAAPRQPSGRFGRGRPWPEGTSDRWRCEIGWASGLVHSHFEAVAYPPGSRRGTAIGQTGDLTALLMADADPGNMGHRQAVRGLAAALKAAGWAPAGHGARWYAGRYVWNSEGTPPDHLELATKSTQSDPAQERAGTGRRRHEPTG